MNDRGTHRPYNNPRWQRMRLIHLKNNPGCVYCGRKANTVDHIVPHKGEASLMWDTKNFQSMCPQCHSGAKRIIENGGQRVEKTNLDGTRDGWG